MTPEWVLPAIVLLLIGSLIVAFRFGGRDTTVQPDHEHNFEWAGRAGDTWNDSTMRMEHIERCIYCPTVRLVPWAKEEYNWRLHVCQHDHNCRWTICEPDEHREIAEAWGDVGA